MRKRNIDAREEESLIQRARRDLRVRVPSLSPTMLSDTLNGGDLVAAGMASAGTKEKTVRVRWQSTRLVNNQMLG